MIQKLDMKKLISIFLIAIISIMVLFPLQISAEEIETDGGGGGSDWKSFDVRTKLSEDVTVESAKKRLKKLGKEDSPFYKEMDYIFDTGEEFGINPTYVLALMALESDWGMSRQAQDHYNYGGIKDVSGDTDDPNGRDASFNDKEDEDKTGEQVGIRAVYELLHIYITEGINGSDKLKTIEDIREVYCPDSDGCNPNYASEVGAIMNGFGQSSGEDGKLKAKSGKGKDGKDDIEFETGVDEIVRAKGAEDFVDREVAKDATGVDDKSNFIGGDLFLVIQNANSKVMMFFGYLGMALVAFLLLFTSISVVGYLVITNNGASSGVMEGFQKVTRVELTRDKSNLMKLMGRWLIVVFFIVLFLTGLYAPIISALLGVLEYVIDFIFGLGG